DTTAIRHLAGRASRTKRQADALEEAEQFEFAFRFHLFEHVLAWKIVDADDDIGGEIAKPFGQMPKDLGSQDLEFGKRWRFDGPPGQWIGLKIGHKARIASLRGAKRRSNPAARSWIASLRSQ